MNGSHFRSSVLVSALVSTYNSERFIAGCMEDLVNQTLFRKGLMEVVVIDCASEQNEHEIVRTFQAEHNNISYIRLSERESLYGAWNVGIQCAKGAFLTNANTDDRHSPDSLEVLLEAISSNDSVDLVYGDVYQSTVPNQPFSENSGEVIYSYPSFFAPDVLLHYQFGCQPMWRRGVHDKMGLFNDKLFAAGDYEFNYRFALAGLNALHVPRVLGSFLERDSSISKSDNRSINEQRALREKYLNSENILRLIKQAKIPLETDNQKISALRAFAARAMCFNLPWHPGKTFADTGVALACLNVALSIDSKNSSILSDLRQLST